MEGHIRWEKSFKLIEDDAFHGREVVYLSPDADEELQAFDKDTVYVIGGLVDATVSLLHTKKKAKQLGVKSYKLAMEQFREKYPFRACLNINHVFDIIDSYHNHGDMTKAIEENLPMRFKTGRNKLTRKLKKLKEKDDEDEDDDEDEVLEMEEDQNMLI